MCIICYCSSKSPEVNEFSAINHAMLCCSVCLVGFSFLLPGQVLSWLCQPPSVACKQRRRLLTGYQKIPDIARSRNRSHQFYTILQTAWQRWSRILTKWWTHKNDLSGPYDDVIKWKHSLRYWLFVRGIDQSPLDSPQKGQWRGALMFSSISASTNSWANNGDAGDLRAIVLMMASL